MHGVFSLQNKENQIRKMHKKKQNKNKKRKFSERKKVYTFSSGNL